MNQDKKIIKFKKSRKLKKPTEFKIAMVKIKKNVYERLEKQAIKYNMDIDTYISIILNFCERDIDKMIQDELLNP